MPHPARWQLPVGKGQSTSGDLSDSTYNHSTFWRNQFCFDKTFIGYNIHWLTWLCDKNKKPRTDHVALKHPTHHSPDTLRWRAGVTAAVMDVETSTRSCRPPLSWAPRDWAAVRESQRTRLPSPAASPRVCQRSHSLGSQTSAWGLPSTSSSASCRRETAGSRCPGLHLRQSGRSPRDWCPAQFKHNWGDYMTYGSRKNYSTKV